jgi:hypothetical protein
LAEAEFDGEVASCATMIRVESSVWSHAIMGLG